MYREDVTVSESAERGVGLLPYAALVALKVWTGLQTLGSWEVFKNLLEAFAGSECLRVSRLGDLRIAEPIAPIATIIEPSVAFQEPSLVAKHALLVEIAENPVAVLDELAAKRRDKAFTVDCHIFRKGCSGQFGKRWQDISQVNQLIAYRA
jgi:hypothetical protein